MFATFVDQSLAFIARLFGRHETHALRQPLRAYPSDNAGAVNRNYRYIICPRKNRADKLEACLRTQFFRPDDI